MTIPKKIKQRLCRLFCKPNPVSYIKKRATHEIGDYADEYSFCNCCDWPIHKDNHIFGDGVWRHVARSITGN